MQAFHLPRIADYNSGNMPEQLGSIELELQVGVAKVSKYATGESGDTLEITERPQGGLSMVLADGQRSGRAAKIISALVARKAIALLGEGVRDGAAARATHDYLRTHRQGQVSAELCIVSLDLLTRTVVISRNSHCPVFILSQEGLRVWDEPSEPIGIHVGVKPVITELPVIANTWVIVFTDGVLEAGQRFGATFDIRAWVTTHLSRTERGMEYRPRTEPGMEYQPRTERGMEYREQGNVSAEALADAILARAVELDQNRPQDDMSVLVLALLPLESTDLARRLTVRFPVPPI
jgi:serine phosphatase RsbU (regulator of sigma subunit)